MKITKTILLSAFALGASTVLATAQGEKPEGGARPPRMVPPLMAALDANKDGTIDATEITNAAAALKTLDKDNDGKLSGDEIRPPRGAGPGGDRRGPDGDRKGPGGDRKGPGDKKE